MITYIIRIYRNEENPEGMAGVVENTGGDCILAFKTVEELWEILKSRETDSSAP